MAGKSSFVLNCVRSTRVEDDWTFDAAAASGLIKRGSAIRKRKDLRADWWSISNQGKSGSCVGWAAADGLLRWHFVKAGKLRKDEKVSVRYVWMSAKETDDFIGYPTTFIEKAGTRLKSALDIARAYGVVKSSVLPFESGKLYQKDAAAFYDEASNLKIACYFNLKGGPKEWRQWIAQQGPILVGLVVDDAWASARKSTAKLYKYDAASNLGGHAALLVGYTETHFIVRNSWGKSWGDHGFAYAYDAYAKAAFFEAYGIKV